MPLRPSTTETLDIRGHRRRKSRPVQSLEAEGESSYSHAHSNSLDLGDMRTPSSSSFAMRDFNDKDADDVESRAPSPPPQKKGPVSWMSLPRKDQLLVLFIGRLADFLQIASLQAYVFYQLKYMMPDVSDSRISERAGILQGCFTGAQVCTAILWGNIADKAWCGRKWALIIGLGGTAVSCLGYGFSTTFFWAAFWRAFGGAINGTVGIM